MLRLWACCGIVFCGKGGEGKGIETRPQSSNSTCRGSSIKKEVSHGYHYDEEEKGKKEEDEDVMTCARLVSGRAVSFGIREAP